MSFGNDMSDEYRDEIFRLNCLEISSEQMNPQFDDEYPILLVDNVLSDDQKDEYEDYISYGRNGMPQWKDYYAVKNLVETLQEVDGLDNNDAVDLLKRVEGAFIANLYLKINVNKDKLSCPIKNTLFGILQKLEFFYPSDHRLVKYLLMIDNRSLMLSALDDAKDQFQKIFQDDHYFLRDEKLLMEVYLNYFSENGKKLALDQIHLFKSEKAKHYLPQFLSEVKVN